MLRFSCTQCGASFTGEARQAGRRFKCPKCSHEFRIPVAAETAPAAPAPKVAPKREPAAPPVVPSVAPPKKKTQAPAPRPQAAKSRGNKIGVIAAAGLGVVAAVVTFVVMSRDGGTQQPPPIASNEYQTPIANPATTEPIRAGAVKPVEWRIAADVEPAVRESLTRAMQALGPIQRHLHCDTAIALATLHARLGDKAAVKKLLEASENPQSLLAGFRLDSPEPHWVRAARVAAELQDAALAVQMFDRALADVKELGQYPDYNNIMTKFSYLLDAQLELGDAAGAKVTADEWRRIASTFPGRNPQAPPAGLLLLAGMLNDAKEMDALLATSPVTDGDGTIMMEPWTIRRLIEARRFDSALFLMTDPRSKHAHQWHDPLGLLARAHSDAGDLEGAIRIAEVIAPLIARQRAPDDLTLIRDRITESLLAKGELDRALAWARQIPEAMDQAVAVSLIAPALAKAGRLDQVKDIARQVRGHPKAGALVAAVLDKLSGDDARYRAQIDTVAPGGPGTVLQRVAEIKAALGDVEGAAQSLANPSIWTWQNEQNLRDIDTTVRAIVEQGKIDVFLNAALNAAGPANNDNRLSARYTMLVQAVGPIARAGGAGKVMEVIGPFTELVPLIVAAQAAAGDLAGARANADTIEKRPDAHSFKRNAIRAKAHAQIGLALVPTARPPVSLADARAGQPKLDLPQANETTRKFALPARPDLFNLTALAQRSMIESSSDNAALLAHVARLQFEMGDKDGARQSLARAQQLAGAVPDTADRIEGFFQIALAYKAAGDKAAAQAALTNCIDATALLESRLTRMKAMEALVGRLLDFKDAAWAGYVATEGVAMAGDLANEELQLQAVALLAKSGDLDRAAQKIAKFHLGRVITDRRLHAALAGRYTTAQVKKFIEDATRPGWAHALWAGVAAAWVDQGNAASAREALAALLLEPESASGSDYCRSLATIADPAGHDDELLALYAKCRTQLNDVVKDRDAKTRAVHVARSLEFFNRAIAPVLARKGRAKEVQELYRTAAGMDLAYLSVLERLAPAVFKAGDRAFYADLLADHKNALDRIDASRSRAKVETLLRLAREQLAAGDLTGGNASIDAAAAIKIPYGGFPVQPLFDALVAAGRTNETVALRPPVGWDTFSRTALYESLLAKGQFAAAQQLALRAGEGHEFVKAVARQARSGDVEGAARAVAGLDPVIWRGYVPYAIVALGQGMVAKDQQPSLVMVNAPEKFKFTTERSLAAKPTRPNIANSTVLNPYGSKEKIVVDKDTPATVEGWIGMLEDPNPHRRAMGISLLRNVDLKAFTAINRLGQLARSDHSPIVREAASNAAAMIVTRSLSMEQSVSPDRLPEPLDAMGVRLGAFFTDRTIDRPLRIMVLDDLRGFAAASSPLGPPIAEAFAAALDDIDDGEAYAARIGQWALISEKYHPMLKAALAHKEAAIRKAAIQPFEAQDRFSRGLRADHKETDPIVMLLLTSEYPELRASGFLRLQKITSESLLALVAMMKTPDINMRASVAVRLAAMERPAPPADFARQHPDAAAILVEAARDNDFATRKAAAAIAASLKLIPAPPGAAADPADQDPVPAKDAPIPNNSRPIRRPGPVKPPAPDDVTISHHGLALTDSITPAVIAQILGRKDQSVETKRMFAHILRHAESQQVFDALLPYIPDMLASKDGDIQFTVASTFSQRLSRKILPRHREAILKALREAYRNPTPPNYFRGPEQLLWAMNALEAAAFDEDKPGVGANLPAFKNNNEARAALRKPNTSPEQILAAISFLINTKASDPDTIGAYVSLLDHKYPRVSLSVAIALREIGPPAAIALKPLVAAIKDEVRPNELQALMLAVLAIGPNSLEADQVCIEAVNNGPYDVPGIFEHITKARKLSYLEIGVDGHWNNHPFRLRAYGLHSSFLKSLPPEELKQMNLPLGLLNALRSRRIDNRIRALTVLNDLKIAGHLAAPTVVEQLKHEERSVRRLAIIVLAGMEQVKDVMTVLESDDEQDRQLAIEVLGRMGAKAAEAVPALEALKRTFPNEATSIDSSIRQIKGEDKTKAPAKPRPR